MACARFYGGADCRYFDYAQIIAYALLAGLPPEAGLYSALLPVLVYALLGSSRSWR